MSQDIALEGMRLVIENLPSAYVSQDDLEARMTMTSATAFKKDLGARLSMNPSIGAVFNTQHGTTNAVGMSQVL